MDAQNTGSTPQGTPDPRHEGTRTPAGASQPAQVQDIQNGQTDNDPLNRADTTGGGQLTKLQENAARGKAAANDPDSTGSHQH